jgi:hypothetical protein
MGYVLATDILPAAALPEVNGEEEELELGWDAI